MAKFRVIKTVPVGPVASMEIAKAAQQQIKSKLKGKASCKFSKITKGQGGFKFKAISSTTINADATVTDLKKAIEAQTKIPGSKVSVMNLTARAQRSNNY